MDFFFQGSLFSLPHVSQWNESQGLLLSSHIWSEGKERATVEKMECVNLQAVEALLGFGMQSQGLLAYSGPEVEMDALGATSHGHGRPQPVVHPGAGQLPF